MKKITLYQYLREQLLDQDLLHKCYSSNPESYPDFVYAKGWHDAIQHVHKLLEDWYNLEESE